MCAAASQDHVAKLLLCTICLWLLRAALCEPALQGKPLVVSHSNSARGAGEVSSANYEARAYGVRASMFIGEAKQRCPGLVVMPYEFEKYEAISKKARAPPSRVQCNPPMCLGGTLPWGSIL